MDWKDRMIKKAQQVAEVNAKMAADEVIMALQKMWGEGFGSQGRLTSNPKESYNAYSESHGRRREREGLQTDRVNLNYSGVFTRSVKIAKEWSTPKGYNVQLQFTGKAHRRKDQKGLSNATLSSYLATQMKQPILMLKKEDKELIEKRYSVNISYQ